MAERIFRLDRRQLLAGIGAVALSPARPDIAAAQGRRSLTLQASAGVVALRPRQPETPVWSLQGAMPDPALRLARGDQLEIRFENNLPVATVLNWHGLDGVPATEALLARSPLSQGMAENLVIPLRHAGTLLCDISLLADGMARPARPMPVVVGETEPVAVDRDEVLLIEDWRLRSDGTALAPGVDPKDATAVYTINGQSGLDITARRHQRLRLRFINGCQRAVIALKIEGYEVRVMALDGRPSEPFPARNGAVVLAPGGRADVFIDATIAGSTSSILLHDGREARPIGQLIVTNEPPVRDAVLPAAPPLPSNGLPERLELRNAQRFEVALGGTQAGWVKPLNFSIAAAPAFRAKTSRTVVLALSNSGPIPAAFHLHGHHFRLLDRLDDGWKPFWLDTLVVEAGQTERIAFAAQYAGRWLIETMATVWAAPRLVRWYSVD